MHLLGWINSMIFAMRIDFMNKIFCITWSLDYDWWVSYMLFILAYNLITYFAPYFVLAHFSYDFNILEKWIFIPYIPFKQLLYIMLATTIDMFIKKLNIPLSWLKYWRLGRILLLILCWRSSNKMSLGGIVSHFVLEAWMTL